MKELNCCFICGAQNVDGIKIKDELLCLSCEKELIITFPLDVEYDTYLLKLKAILFS
ncbi:sigma factor G inhibitor Gin [Fuchsiella alkaliacetigena]|uniref:sigma factor G inhibitor Gin n=1 Tax=Fuchsiella alkaliacetigena TaxID=957042 RepID=UPI00200AE2CC|nr:sigma factor G inhibitor Gin [Fuchsiella alkaliacetigena]MCK8824504.1 sigma factor G inhibitor Gin [Fuchsiella alkaliacetigena]